LTGEQPALEMWRAPQSAGHRPDRGQRLWRARRSENATTAALCWYRSRQVNQSVKGARRSNGNRWAGKSQCVAPCLSVRRRHSPQRRRRTQSQIAGSPTRHRCGLHRCSRQCTASSRIITASLPHPNESAKKGPWPEAIHNCINQEDLKSAKNHAMIMTPYLRNR